MDPVNLFLPGTFLFKASAREAGAITRMAGTALAASTAAGVQEGILHQAQLSRTANESAWNIASSAIVGGLIGGAGPVVGRRIRTAYDAGKEKLYQRAKQEITDVYTDNPKALDSNGLLKENDINNMPELVRKTMKVGPLNQLLNSPFGISKYFGATMYEHNYTLNKHLDFDTEGSSIERIIKGHKQRFAKHIINYQKIFYEANGIDSGPFKFARSKLRDLNINWDDFDNGVSLVLTGGEHANPHVKRGAEYLRKHIYDPLGKEAQELGLLPGIVTGKRRCRSHPS